VVFRLSDLTGSTNVGNRLARGQRLLRGFELAENVLRCVAGLFRGVLPAQPGRMETLIHRGPIAWATSGQPQTVLKEANL